MRKPFAFLAALLATTPSMVHAETLMDAIQMAYDSNPDLRAQRAGLGATNEGYVQAKSGYGPQVSVTGGYEYQDVNAQLPPTLLNSATQKNYSLATGQADLSLVQPLYTAGRNKSHVAEASDNIMAGRQDLRAEEAKLLLNVITAYMDVLKARQTVRIVQGEIDELTSAQREIESRGQVGDMSRTDVAQAQARLLAEHAQLLQAQGVLGAASSDYLATVGQNPGELQAPPDLPGVPGNVDDAFDAATQNNADLMGALQKERAARERVNEAKAQNGPTVSLKLDAGIEPDATYLPNQYERSVAAAVMVTQPIYTSGMNSSKIREAIDLDSNAELLIESMRRDVVRRVSQAWDQLTSSRNALTVVSQQLGAEEVAAKGMRLEERAGLRSTIDLLNADAELTNTRLGEVQDRHDEYIARASVLAAMGALEVRYLSPGLQQDDPMEAFKRVEHKTAPVWEDGIGILLDQIAAPSTPPPGSSASAGARRPDPVDHPASVGAEAIADQASGPASAPDRSAGALQLPP